MQEFVDKIRAVLVAHTELDPADVKLEKPRDAALGDLAFPCFPLAKVMRNAPPKIAAELGPKVEADLDGIAVEITGPYLNFRIDRSALAASVLGAVERDGDAYGGSDVGAGKTIVIDFSSPNIAKPFHVGHLRSTMIGAALQRLFDALGYRTVGINHIGDWGSQFGKLVAAIQRWGDEYDLEEKPIDSLLALYVRFHEAEDSDPELVEAGRAAFRELESGEEGEVRRIWRRLTELSLKEFDRSYERLGVSFDYVRGEAFYEPYLEDAIQRIQAAGVTEESEGALVVQLDQGDYPPCLLRKTDGTTLYATRDLAALFHRWEEFAFERCLYVVGSPQKLHFTQLKCVLERMGLEWESRVEHVDFGQVLGISTRKGNVVFLAEILDRAVEEAHRIIQEKNPDLADAESVAQTVGIGAVVFNDLKRERIKDVNFDWKEILSFEGETGPYVQYTHARLASILRKAADQGLGDAPAELARLDDASDVLLALGRFPAVVATAARRAEPSEVARYVLELCREVNSWYVNHRVLTDDPGLCAARLGLVRATKTVIRNGLRLLGLGAPEEM